MIETFKDSILIELGRRLDGFPLPISSCQCGKGCDIGYVAMCDCCTEPDFDENGNMYCVDCGKAFKPVREWK